MQYHVKSDSGAIRLSMLACAAAAGVAILLTSNLSTAAVITTRTVALSGTAYPDASGSTAAATTAGNSFGSPTANTNPFSSASLNNSGLTVFASVVTGAGIVTTPPGSANNGGVWTEGSGTLKLFAQKLDAAPTYNGTLPGQSVVNFQGVSSPVINSAGVTADGGALQGSSVTATGYNSSNAGLFTDYSGIKQLIVQKYDPTTVDSTPENFMSTGGNAVENASGNVAFAAPLGTTTFTSTANSVWVGSPQSSTATTPSVTEIASFLDAAPGTPAKFGGSTAFGNPTINSSGTIAFSAGLVIGGTVVSGSNNTGIWAGSSPANLHLIARGGDTAPGTGGGTFTTSLTSSNNNDINAAGTVAFQDTLNAIGSVSSSTNAGIWKGASEAGLTLVAQKGSAAAGLTGVNYASFSNPVINTSGYTAFEAGLSGAVTAGTSDTGLFAENSGGVGLIAQAGTLASNGQYFRSFSTTPDINALGDVAFTDTMSSTLGGASVGTALWAEDSTGALDLVAETGQTFLGKTISTINFNSTYSGNEDGRESAWNDNSTVAYSLLFSDGTSGVYTTSVPEPASIGLLAGGALLLGRRTRKTNRAR